MNETYLNEYFKYIKVVFLREYSKYLTEEKINKIRNMDNIFRIDEISKYKVFITDKINICTNIKDFIEENNLNNDSDLRDISIDGRIYVKYLLDNRETPLKFILDTILQTIIKYFIRNCDNVIKIGMADIIAKELEIKYNLKNIKPYKSKELTVANKIKEIVTDDIFYVALLNDKEELIKEKYDKYINNELYGLDYETLLRELNKEYFDGYYKKIGKVYFSDTLYDYENVNYNKILTELDKISEFHNKNISIKIKHIFSAKQAILELKNHLIIFDSNEQFLINNFLIEIENMLNKIDETNVEILYQRFEKLEDQIFPLVQKLWKKEINNPLYYTEDEQYKFLIGEYPNSTYTETRLISKLQLDKIPCKIKEYGFMYSANENIVYSSTKNFLYSIDADKLEIDDISDSKLITPNIIINDNLKNNSLTGKILLKNAIPCGVYVISESKYYDKALEFADKYELPLVKINCITPQIKTEEKEKQEKIKQEIPKQKKEPLLNRIRNFSHKMIYEEEIEEFKKTI